MKRPPHMRNTLTPPVSGLSTAQPFTVLHSEANTCLVVDCLHSQHIPDLIFTSVVDNITQSGVLAVGISDHLVIYCTRKVTRAKSGCHKCSNAQGLVFTVSFFGTQKWTTIFDCC